MRQRIVPLHVRPRAHFVALEDMAGSIHVEREDRGRGARAVECPALHVQPSALDADLVDADLGALEWQRASQGRRRLGLAARERREVSARPLVGIGLRGARLRHALPFKRDWQIAPAFQRPHHFGMVLYGYIGVEGKIAPAGLRREQLDQPPAQPRLEDPLGRFVDPAVRVVAADHLFERRVGSRLAAADPVDHAVAADHADPGRLKKDTGQAALAVAGGLHQEIGDGTAVPDVQHHPGHRIAALHDALADRRPGVVTQHLLQLGQAREHPLVDPALYVDPFAVFRRMHADFHDERACGGEGLHQPVD